jgi:vacuolar-type H+-ATPase subunit C/Vma6
MHKERDKQDLSAIAIFCRKIYLHRTLHSCHSHEEEILPFYRPTVSFQNLSLVIKGFIFLRDL